MANTLVVVGLGLGELAGLHDMWGDILINRIMVLERKVTTLISNTVFCLFIFSLAKRL
jgi:hypothetical protein